MAEQPVKSRISGDHKYLSEDAPHGDEQPGPSGIATSDDDLYPLERVEAVYRKLDLRIIPGPSLSTVSSQTHPH